MIAIIDYDAGNLTSVERALRHIGHPCCITRDPGRIADAERIVFPGVGAAGAAMESLRRLGLDRVLASAFAAGKPILGICLGSQIVLSHSQENQAACLDLLPGHVSAFPLDMTDANGRRLKVPHMGWNRLRLERRHPVLEGLQTEDEFYFVHGYYPVPREAGHVLGTTEHGLRFASVLGHRNLLATQFHPEKSGRPGLRILDNFCRWHPAAEDAAAER